jgi:hypothetical protein
MHIVKLCVCACIYLSIYIYIYMQMLQRNSCALSESVLHMYYNTKWACMYVSCLCMPVECMC